MSYTPVMATSAEIMAFNKDQSADSFGLLQSEWETAFEVLHAAVEGTILQYMNRTELTAADLAGSGYSVMAAVLKAAVIMYFSNWFMWMKSAKQGRVVSVTEGLAYLQEPKIFSQQIKDMLNPYRFPMGGAVSPADEDSDGDGVTDEITYQYSEGEYSA